MTTTSPPPENIVNNLHFPVPHLIPWPSWDKLRLPEMKTYRRRSIEIATTQPFVTVELSDAQSIHIESNAFGNASIVKRINCEKEKEIIGKLGLPENTDGSFPIGLLIEEINGTSVLTKTHREIQDILESGKGKQVTLKLKRSTPERMKEAWNDIEFVATLQEQVERLEKTLKRMKEKIEEVENGVTRLEKERSKEL
eukprot:g5959.t1